MYMGNLSLRTFFNIFFFIRKFSNFRICSNLVGFNRINSIEFLLNVQNQLNKPMKYNVSKSDEVVSQNADRDLFDKLLVAAGKRNLDLQEVLNMSFPLFQCRYTIYEI